MSVSCDGGLGADAQAPNSSCLLMQILGGNGDDSGSQVPATHMGDMH